MWEVRAEIQVSRSRRKLHTHIYLDYTRVKFLSCIKKNFNFFHLYITPKSQLKNIKITLFFKYLMVSGKSSKLHWKQMEVIELKWKKKNFKSYKTKLNFR